jgi:flagellar biosynthesis/type III secretory pathway protein FliH
MATFSSLARESSFQALGISRQEGASPISPLPVATSIRPGDRRRPGGSQLRNVTGKPAEEEPAAPVGPPPPTHQELEEAQAARAQADEQLGEARRELEAIKAQLAQLQQANAGLVQAFDQALEGVQSEMRAAYADLVLEGCRRLLGSLSESEAIFHTRLDTVSEQLVLENDVVLKVAPQHKRAAETAIFGRMGWSVEVDPSMDGGCVAVCRNAMVDARLETAFEGLERSLSAWLSQDGRAPQGK